MTAHTRSTWCRVQIVTPELRDGSRGAVYTWDGRRGELSGLLGVSVSVGLELGANRFSLRFSPERFGVDSWADRVPRYSVVFIEMGSSDETGSDPTVLVGITDPATEAESWQSGSPQRSITISGRGIDSILDDAGVWHAPYLELNRAAIPETLRRAVVTPYIEALLGTPMWLRGLWGNDTDPREALVRILAFYLANTETTAVNLLLPTPYSVRDLVTAGSITGKELDDSADAVFHATPTGVDDTVDLLGPGSSQAPTLMPIPADWSIVDVRLRVFASTLHPAAGSVLSVLHQVFDPVFHELFVAYERPNIAAPASSGAQTPRARIVHRVKPFLRSRPDPSADTASRFEPDAVETVSITAGDIIARQMRHGMEPVHNIFYVLPAHAGFFEQGSFKAQLAPAFCGDTGDHAYIGRYGVRPLEVSNPYVAVNDRQTSDVPALIAISTTLADVLKAWHDPHPVMLTGTITVPGRASIRPGTRLLVLPADDGWSADLGPSREFYVEGVAHQYDFATGAWLTTANVSRGWTIGASQARRAS